MKIVQINATYGIGSTGTICEEISKHLTENGYECRAYYGNSAIPDSRAVRMTGKLGVRLHSLFARIFGLAGYYSTHATARLIRELREYKPDVVHLHNLHGNYVNVPKLLRYLKKSNTGTVITLHDCWFFTGKCTHYTSCGCDRWQSECGKCPQLSGDIPSYVFDRTKKMLRDKREIFEGFDKLDVIAVSDWIKSEAERSILGKNRIHRIYNWVDLGVFYPREREPRDHFLILAVSASWNKDMPKFKDVLRLSEIIPDGARICMVGRLDGIGELPENVQSIPYVSDKAEMARLYSNADVYVHLSREDSFGKVITEALACGTPVVVYNSTACPELVGEGCGYVAEAFDVRDVCEKVKAVMEHGRDTYSEACVRFSHGFDKEEILKKTLELYIKNSQG
ncbi:MAG: glycosyltransferase [Clostridia bacterium]|nr:glycosyltransferase [Clostridia bacterium]